MLSSILSKLIMPAHCSTAQRVYVVVFLLWPAIAFCDDGLAKRLRDVGEIAHFVPDLALKQLKTMQREIATAPESLRVDFLYYYSCAERSAGNPTRALKLADELVDYGKQKNDNVALTKGLLGRANALYILEELSAAQATSFHAERIAFITSDIGLRVEATVAAGQSFEEQGNYPAALLKIQTAVDIARRMDGSTASLASSLSALTSLYLNMGQLDKGGEAQRELLALARATKSPGRIAVALRNEYALAVEHKQFERARHALFEELDLERSIGARQMVSTTLVNLSDCYLKESEFGKAQTYAAEALQAAIDVNSNNDIATARVNLGQAYLGLGLPAEGKQQFESGLAAYEKQGDKPELQAVLLEYGAALENAGDYKGATDAYHRERRISREMFAEQRQKAVLELQEKYDTEKSQHQIEALHAELEKRRLQQRIWWLLAVVFALASVVVGLLYRKIRHANAQLEAKNLELKQQSSLDPLTMLYNRRHFQEFMRNQDGADGERRAAEDTVGALFLLDVDHFKNVNDTFGHAAGDGVLKMIAQNLCVTLRETDMIVRWGGEEFLVFMPALSRNGLDDVARRILDSISSQPLEYQGSIIPINVSVGFSPFPLEAGETPLTWERTVNLIDMALYLAKSHGRNRAYGVNNFVNFGQITMDAIEQDLETAWREGFVEMSVVLGSVPGERSPANACEPGNQVPAIALLS